MSQENVEIVRSILAAFAVGDRERMLESIDPEEMVIDATRRVFNPATYVGIEGVSQMLGEMYETWAEFRLEQQEFVDGGDRIAVLSRLVGMGKGSGVEVGRPFDGQVWTVREGRVVRLEFGFADRAETLEAAGVSE